MSKGSQTALPIFLSAGIVRGRPGGRCAMARKLILCLDGTWNHPDDDQLPDDVQVETNVRRIFEAALDGSKVPNQVKWYDDGIGGPGSSWFDRLGAGAFGLGLDI